MTSEATAGQIADVYGQVHPVETPELLKTKRSEMETELDLIPPDEKQAWMQALAKCDESLVGDDFKLKFLRCEVFNADVSVGLYSCIVCVLCRRWWWRWWWYWYLHLRSRLPLLSSSSRPNDLSNTGRNESRSLAPPRPLVPYRSPKD